MNENCDVNEPRNRTKYCYDASGNLLDAGPCPMNGNHQFTYDAEERIATAMHGNIVNTYGADGLRASTGVAGQTPTDFLYDYDGSILAHQISGAYGPQEIWVNGKHFGFINLVGSPVSAVLTQSLTDWLGTERARMDAAGNLQATFCNLPFGDQLTTCFGTDPNPADVTHLTGKERDNAADDVNGVNGLDYFGARHYSSSMGRWMTPDWSENPNAVPYGDLGNPQSLNLYSYVNNNPLSHRDVDGHHQECSRTMTTTYSTDANGELQAFNNVTEKCVEVPDPSLFQRFMNWRQKQADAWNARIAAHAPPPQPPNNNLTVEQIFQSMINVVGGTRIASPRANKLNHIFDPKHNLEPLVREFGSQEGAMEAIEKAASEQLGSNISGDGQIIQVGQYNVTVTGGSSPAGPQVGNAWIPGPGQAGPP